MIQDQTLKGMIIEFNSNNKHAFKCHLNISSNM